VVADLHVAAVRALLTRDVDEHLRLIEAIDREGSAAAYGVLYKAAFMEAVRRRFGPVATRGDVIHFVAETRASRSRDVADIDILAAERLLLAMLGDQRSLRGLTEEDEALISPLLLELGRTLPVEELLVDAQQMTKRLENAFAEGRGEGEE
jgi:hypothetical protein